jgi:ankyrin repeat protein
VNAQDVSGKTLLMQYAEVGDTNACRYLLEHGAKADIKDRTGKTVVDYICAKVEKPDDKLKSQILSLLKPSEAKPSQ